MKNTDKPNTFRGFNIRGSSAISMDRLPKIVRKTIEFLDKQNPNDLWPGNALCGEIGYMPGSFGCTSGHPALQDYRYKHGNNVLYGSKKAIAALVKSQTAPVA